MDIDNDMTDDELKSMNSVHIDAPEHGEWHIAFATVVRNGVEYFYSMCAIDSFECGAGWNLYLSKYLPDEVIETIYDKVSLWESIAIDDDIRTRVMTLYTDDMEIGYDCSVSR
jgi:hypothetical protein